MGEAITPNMAKKKMQIFSKVHTLLQVEGPENLIGYP